MFVLAILLRYAACVTVSLAAGARSILRETSVVFLSIGNGRESVSKLLMEENRARWLQAGNHYCCAAATTTTTTTTTILTGNHYYARKLVENSRYFTVTVVTPKRKTDRHITSN